MRNCKFIMIMDFCSNLSDGFNEVETGILYVTVSNMINLTIMAISELIFFRNHKNITTRAVVFNHVVHQFSEITNVYTFMVYLNAFGIQPLAFTTCHYVSNLQINSIDKKNEIKTV